MNPTSQGVEMQPKLSSEEQKKILETPPKGTLFIFLIFGVIFTLAWLILFFARFVHNGPVS
jgi:hypothetical protein